MVAYWLHTTTAAACLSRRVCPYFVAVVVAAVAAAGGGLVVLAILIVLLFVLVLVLLVVVVVVVVVLVVVVVVVGCWLLAVCCWSFVVGCLLLAPVVRHDAFYALLFCLAVRVYVYFSPHLSRGSTGWVGVGGGGGGGFGWGGGGGLIAFCRLLPVASSFRHAPDVTLYRSSLATLDTLPMLRSIDLLLQPSTRSRCYAL